MIDFASAVRRLGGDRELYGEVALLFASVCPASIDELAAAITARDWSRTTLVAHRLRGGFATVGAADLELLALWIETSCGKCEACELDEALEELRDGGQDMIAQLKAYSEDLERDCDPRFPGP